MILIKYYTTWENPIMYVQNILDHTHFLGFGITDFNNQQEFQKNIPFIKNDYQNSYDDYKTFIYDDNITYYGCFNFYLTDGNGNYDNPEYNSKLYYECCEHVEGYSYAYDSNNVCTYELKNGELELLYP